MPPLVLGAIGAGMAAAGTGVGVGAMKVKGTRPDRGVGNFGGSAEESDQFKNVTDAGIAEGNTQVNSGSVFGAGAVADANTMGATGGGIADAAAIVQGERALQARNAASQLGAFKSKAPNVGAMMGQQALDAGRRQALSLVGAARGGNQAAGMRDALAANTQATADASAAAQIAGAQHQLAAEGMQQQGLMASGQQLAGLAALEGQNMDRGFGLQQFDVNTGMGFGNQLMNTGAGREATFLNAQAAQGALEGQLQTQLEIENAKAQQDKRNGLLQLGGALIGGGGAALGSGKGK